MIELVLFLKSNDNFLNKYNLLHVSPNFKYLRRADDDIAVWTFVANRKKAQELIDVAKAQNVFYDYYHEEITAKTIHEYCPHCEKEVQILAIGQCQKCPDCGEDILPCALCNHNMVDCTKCYIQKIKAEH